MDVLNGTTTDYYDGKATNLLDRWAPVTDWANARAASGLDPYSKSTASRIAPTIEAFDRIGRPLSGFNFGSQDYLGLSSHPQILEAARRASERYGVHSAGSAALMGLNAVTLQLEERIARFVGLADATVFPTGWAAGFGTIRALVKENDHIIIDLLAHACLQEAANASTQNVHRFPHGSTEGVERRLKRIREAEPETGILVVVESLYSMDSDAPDIATLQGICRRYDATLFVDVAHDLGAMGPTGRGVMELQNVVGQADVVMGSFSKTFASNGGFAASNHPALKLALRYGSNPLTFSNALSPVQAAVVLACLDIIDSDEGADKRSRLLANATYLRERLLEEDFKVLGMPSAIVPVVLGDNATSRQMTSAAHALGAIVNLVEYPAVARNACRWRIQLMSEHTEADLAGLVRVAKLSRGDIGEHEMARRHRLAPSEAGVLAH